MWILGVMILVILLVGYDMQIGYEKFDSSWLWKFGRLWIQVADSDGARCWDRLVRWWGVQVYWDNRVREGEMLKLVCRMFYREENEWDWYDR